MSHCKNFRGVEDRKPYHIEGYGLGCMQHEEGWGY